MGDRRRRGQYGCPAYNLPQAIQQDLFASADQRRRQVAERIGGGKVVFLGMNIDGVNYQGILLPQKEHRTRNF